MGILIVVFAVSFCTILVVVGAVTWFLKSQQKQQIRSMLRSAEATPTEQRGSDLLLPDAPDDGFAKLLGSFALTERLELIIEQSGQHTTVSKVLFTSCLVFAVGFFLGTKIHIFPPQLSGLVCGAFGGSIPLLLILRKRAKNIAAFEGQLPEALDFLSRSMRAGHGFSIALEMLAADSPDPLGSAFRRVSNDMQLGSSLNIALGKLLILAPSVDVRFFVSSVLLQQETGGNLGEVLSKLALIIRERFRLKGQVKAASAHGRITGLVLFLMPVAVAVIMMVTSPQYLLDLAADHTGRIMIYGACCGQVVGFFVIRKIINIKV